MRHKTPSRIPADLAGVPVVFLPGTLCDARVFATLTDTLSPGRVIHADLCANVTATAAAARWLAALPDRFVAVGFSLGAIVALEMAAQAPERLAGLALIAGNARDVPPADHAARRAAVVGVDPARLVGTDLWPRSVHPARQGDADLRARIVAMAEACPAGTAERQIELALSRIDSRPRLAAMAMPVLILSGADDMIAPRSLQAEMAAGLPCAQWIEIADAGHFLLLEQPSACAAAFSTWLAQVDLHHARANAHDGGALPAFSAPEVP